MSSRDFEELSEQALLSFVREGNVSDADSALNELLSRHYQGIVRMAFIASRDEALSLDCAQEVLFELVKSIPQFKGDSQFSTWVYTISRRTIWKLLRKRKQTRTVEGTRASDSLIERESSTEQNLVSQEGQLIAEQEQQRIFAAIETLPTKQKEAILLFYYEDLGLNEIAERIGCAPATVKAHLFKARASLARKLGCRTGDLDVKQN